MLRLAFVAAVLAASLHARDGVAVYLDFEHRASEKSVAAMKREVNELMSPAGLRLHWRTLKENRGDEPFSNLVVVKLRGVCRVRWSFSSRDTGEVMTLGTTRRAGSRVLPYSEVDCDSVREAVARSRVPQRESTLGRALGRVLAHELYHVLARTTRHAREGIAKSMQSWHDLVGKRAAFLEPDAALLRETAP